MKRWNGKDNIENEKIDEFLSKVTMLSVEYGFSISHEDGFGAFEIHDFNQDDIIWLMDAHDKTGV